MIRKGLLLKVLVIVIVMLSIYSSAFASDQTWQLITDNYADIKTVGWSVPSLVDIDADGDVDMFIGSESSIVFYRNDGNATSPQWTFVTDKYADFDIFGYGGCAAPALTDIDNDGDYDLFISSCGSPYGVYFYRNDGTPQNPQWTFITDRFIEYPDPGCSQILIFVDIDGDKDSDLFLGSCDWNNHYFENTGNPSNPSFEYKIRDYIYNAVGLENYGNYLVFEDIDLDGDLDMLASNTRGYLAYLRNIGNKYFPNWELVTTTFPNVADINQRDWGYIFPVFVDIDADGQKEIIMGGGPGYLSFFDNISKPPIISVQIDIKPGSFPNAVKLQDTGNIPVAIFSTSTFDARTIDVSTLELNGGEVRFVKGKGYLASSEDVNGDGLLDLVVQFNRGDAQLTTGDASGTVAGKTTNGILIQGIDSLKIIE